MGVDLAVTSGQQVAAFHYEWVGDLAVSNRRQVAAFHYEWEGI